MKILLANYRYFISGGPERYMFNLQDHLSKNNHEIIPYSINYSKNQYSKYSKYFASPLGNKNEIYFDQQRMAPATICKTFSRLFYSNEVEKSVSKIIGATQPQIAYILHYLRKLSPSILVGIKKKKIPIVVRLSDYAMLCPQAHCLRDNKPCSLCLNQSTLNSIRFSCVKNNKIASLLNMLATWFHNFRGYFDLIDSFVTTNTFMYELMQEAGWPKEKLINIPTFTDINKFQPTSDFKKSNYICYLGRLDEPKGIDILIKAFSKIKKQTSTDLVLKIAGKGSQFYTEKLKKTAKENGLDNSIHFVGQLDNIKIPNFLGNALLTVVPSLWYENLPNSILESYSCGTPVVASDLGSLSGCVTQGITGSLFKTGSTNELAKKIWLLLDDKNLLAEMAINSRIEALDKYSPKTHMGLLEDLFNKLIK